MISLYDIWGDYDKAQAVAEETIKLAPGRQLYRFLYGIVLIHQNQISQAIEQFETAFRMDPTYLDAIEYYALALIYGGDNSLYNDLVEGRYGEQLLQDEEFVRGFTSQEDIETVFKRLSTLDTRFAVAFASLGKNDMAARVYERLILRKIEEGRKPPGEYFTQYTLLSIESVGGA